MDNTIFNMTLRRIRKEKGVTQEQLADAVGVSAQAVSKWEMTSFPDAQLLPAIAEFLGVTIDELFGKEKEEKIDIYNAVLQHLNKLPREQRFQEMFAICRAFPLGACGCDEYQPILNNVLQNTGWDNYSQVDLETGFMQSRNNGNLQYFLLMPKPEQGYDDVLAYQDKAVRFFEVMAIPNALRVIYFLMGSKDTMFFKASTLAHELKITMENAEEIISGLSELDLIWEGMLNEGVESGNIYQFRASCDFLSFLNITRTLLSRPCSFNYHQSERKEPYFQHKTHLKTMESCYRREKDSKDEKDKR